MNSHFLVKFAISKLYSSMWHERKIKEKKYMRQIDRELKHEKKHQLCAFPRLSLSFLSNANIPQKKLCYVITLNSRPLPASHDLCRMTWLHILNMYALLARPTSNIQCNMLATVATRRIVITPSIHLQHSPCQNAYQLVTAVMWELKACYNTAHNKMVNRVSLLQEKKSYEFRLHSPLQRVTSCFIFYLEKYARRGQKVTSAGPLTAT